jgi:hypothetical protein
VLDFIRQWAEQHTVTVKQPETVAAYKYLLAVSVALLSGPAGSQGKTPCALRVPKEAHTHHYAATKPKPIIKLTL